MSPKCVEHRGRRGARLARREERPYREYASDEQRRQAGVPGARSLRAGVERGCPARKPVVDQPRRATRGRITLRTAEASEAKKLHAIIQANLEEGHLLPRTLSELTAHAARFVVAVRGRKIVGCGELASLSARVAEVRSLAVDAGARGSRVGVMIVDELRRRARREGFEKLCAFTHAPGYFIHMGFSIRSEERRVGKECRL